VWRAFFMALGLNSMLLGGECFVLERIELSKSFTSIVAGQDPMLANSARPSNSSVFQNSAYQAMMADSLDGSGRMFRPREWMPWSLLAVGAIIVMYTSSHARKPA